MPKGTPTKGYALTPQREKVLRILATEGPLDDEAGLVVSKLKQRTGHAATQGLSMVIKELETAGLVKREVIGRRTFHLEIVPENIATEDRARLGISTEKGTILPAEYVEVVETATAEEPEATDSTDGTDYRKLADELLKAASTVLARKAGDPQLKVKLLEAEARADVERKRADHLEMQLIERGEEVLRLKEQVRIAEKNLATVQKQRAKQTSERGSDSVSSKLTDRERRELDDLKRMMQSPPAR